jgi:hypothetical protein
MWAFWKIKCFSNNPHEWLVQNPSTPTHNSDLHFLQSNILGEYVHDIVTILELKQHGWQICPTRNQTSSCLAMCKERKKIKSSYKARVKQHPPPVHQRGWKVHWSDSLFLSLCHPSLTFFYLPFFLSLDLSYVLLSSPPNYPPSHLFIYLPALPPS